ncbi:uncharacterized protein BP5553_09242 [Venustampulla echinocandica]|uniref:NYN domain-containing protein n=1 Tax=Venustampulla echinocandica TaxID=2656787 RepID=A0A370TC56_9HELO|nr:uncharacterized protein BP5553_09242 [Venustampulla echinocandica]RDL31840.1 hypothetical protein BP5553_09242 [Venustampulla echinocandica]
MAVTVNDTGPWSFREARQFLRSFDPPSLPPDPNSSNLRPPSKIALDFDPSEFNPKSSASKALGDFDRLYAFCGIPINKQSRGRNDSAESSSSDPSSDPYSTSLSSAPDDALKNAALGLGLAKVDLSPLDDGGQSDGFISKAKEVRWKDEIPGQDISESRMRRTSASAGDVDLAELIGLLEDGSETEPAAQAKLTAISKHLVKSKPLTGSPATPTYFDSKYIEPLYPLTITEAKAGIIKKLRKMKLISPSSKPTGAISRFAGYSDNNGIHVFVDLSNIVIGFHNKLKADRGIPQDFYVKQAPICFHSLAFIFERSRGVARRVLTGSHGGLLYGQKHRRPDYMAEAEKCGYEMNILEPVYKAKLATPVKRRKGTGNGYATTSGHSSGSDTAHLLRPSRSEQCVDEILQMKMLESLVDTEKPSTMVLASGDAAEAEFSGGFLKTVERFLQKGWKVELLSWSSGLSKEYLSKSFLKKWEGRFCIIALDEFSEELLAVYASSYPAELDNY